MLHRLLIEFLHRRLCLVIEFLFRVLELEGILHLVESLKHQSELFYAQRDYAQFLCYKFHISLTPYLIKYLELFQRYFSKSILPHSLGKLRFYRECQIKYSLHKIIKNLFDI